jgi:ATP-dependent exoDNAse (exonuclease V) beta subunit
MFWISKENKMQPVEWGEFVHQALSEVQQANDIKHVLDPYLTSGVIDSKTASMLRGLFEQMVIHPMIYEAFSDQAKIKNECEILSRQYGIIRPDRYAEFPDKIILLDYKTGAPSNEHHKQLKQYESVLRQMVNKEISSYLVYLSDTINVVPVR